MQENKTNKNKYILKRKEGRCSPYDYINIFFNFFLNNN